MADFGRPGEVLVSIKGKEHLLAVIKTAAPWPWLVTMFTWPDLQARDLVYMKDEIEARRFMRRTAQLMELGKEV